MLLATALPRVSWMLLSCLMILSQVQGDDSQSELGSPSINCPKGTKTYGSFCYAVFKTQKTWMDAELACQKMPLGNLVSVLNRAEASFVSSLIRSTVNSHQFVWLGLSDPTEGSEPNGEGWEWSSTNLLRYTAWDTVASNAGNRGFCASLTRSSKFLKWRDYNCDVELPYVCKFRY
ncbi:regenerating islet-derived protein 3-gamma-like [Ochotona curzoniae]|uniref:regenerating islet-derived protein 3-gamma-like n=1 Tax=Ochotona curzoniae TaxID=130825 RepID=UPI001B353C62|nr:regenerating islet-derived protein 3-gamma-like [Ochotona curzoniae]